MQPPRPREWPALEPAMFAAALVAYGVATPLGLDRVSAAEVVARGWALSGDLPPAPAPLALLALRAAAYLPLGDLAARANVASALLGALAVALLARLACEALIWLRPPPSARQSARDFLAEPIAAAGAAAAIGMTLATFRAATAAGTAAATLALVAGGWVTALRLLRAPDDARTAGTLALLAGLAPGVDACAAAVLWLPGAALWLWRLRRGSRWPLVAPLLFSAGLGVSLFAVAAADAAPSLGAVARAFWPVRATDGVGPIRELAEQMGVVGLLIAAVGLATLAVRATAPCALLLWALAVGAWVSGPALLVALAALAAPLAAGIVHLAGKLGRGRAAAATALAAIALVSPALDGGAARWRAEARLPMRLMHRALDETPLRAVVDPGTPEMHGLFGYAAALGLRPDLALRPVAPPKAR